MSILMNAGNQFAGLGPEGVMGLGMLLAGHRQRYDAARKAMAAREADRMAAYGSHALAEDAMAEGQAGAWNELEGAGEAGIGQLDSMGQWMAGAAARAQAPLDEARKAGAAMTGAKAPTGITSDPFAASMARAGNINTARKGMFDAYNRALETPGGEAYGFAERMEDFGHGLRTAGARASEASTLGELAARPYRGETAMHRWKAGQRRTKPNFAADVMAWFGPQLMQRSLAGGGL